MLSNTFPKTNSYSLTILFKLTPSNVSSGNSFDVSNKVNILGTPCPFDVSTMNFIYAFATILELDIT